MAVITIVGAGMMGSAMSVPATDNGHEVRLVGTPLDDDIIRAVRATGEHPKMHRKLPEKIRCYTFDEVDRALAGMDPYINAVSSFGVDWFAQEMIPRIPESVPVISVTKGMEVMEDGRLVPFPVLLKDRLPEGKRLSLNAIGGPCTSYELADRHQTTVAFCGDDLETLKYIRSLLKTDYYHIRVSTDVVGVECAVAMKNAYALGVSLAIGLAEKQCGIGCTEHYNAQAALFGQSVKEMRRLLALVGGGDENIVFGAGDLYVTIFGGRTRRIGTLLGRGLTFDEAMAELSGVTLESVVIASRTAKSIRILAERGLVRTEDYPLLMHVDDIISRGAPVDIPWDAFTEQ